MRILIIILLGLNFAFAQNQASNFDVLSSRIQEYLNNSPVVYPYLTFNQEKFTPGDTLFFKANLRDISNNQVNGRALMQLWLTNASGKVVERIFFSLINGSGFGQVIIPDSLSAGGYRVTVLNEWMQNFNSQLFFEKEIMVVKEKELKRREEELSVQFHVEGGKLVEGVPNKVVLFSSIPELEFIIEDGSRHEITRVRVDEKGSGFFVFTPQNGRSYSLFAESTLVRFPLPEAGLDGVSLLLNQSSEFARLLFAVPKESRLRNEDYMVLLVSGQQIHYKGVISFREKEVITITLPNSNLPKGIMQVLLVDRTGELVAQRCYLKSDNNKVEATLQIPPGTLSQRTKIRLDIILKDEQGNPMPGEFVVKAINRNLFNQEIGEQEESIIDIISGFSSLNERQIDNRMIAFTGFHYWEQILSQKTQNKKYPFRTLLNVHGQLRFKNSGELVPDSTIVMVYLQKHFMGYESLIKNEKLDINFLFNFFNQDDLFYTAEYKGQELTDIELELDSEMPILRAATRLLESSSPDALAQFASKSKLIFSSYQFYSSQKQAQQIILENPNADFEDEFMGADVTVNVEDFLVFPTMEELIREVIPALQHRKVKGKNIVRVVFSKPSVYPTGDPLYIIDGVMTKNTSFFLSLSPSDIITLKVERELSKLSRLGTIGKNGIVYVHTKRPDIVKRLNEVNTMIAVQGLNKPVEKKQVLQSDWRKPDFRSTVYWNPVVKSDTSGEATLTFYVGDDVGLVDIFIEGFAQDGRPFSQKQPVNVSFVAGQKN